MRLDSEYIIGIDEAGRGPLAGPVAVGVVMVPADFKWTLIKGVNDSKQLSPRVRAAIFKDTRRLKRAGRLAYSVVLVGARVIDERGIVPAINTALARGLKRVTGQTGRVIRPEDSIVLLDGGLRAPAMYLNQETIIKGDAKEKVIGLASIMAKVTRDRYMERRAKLAAYAKYDFAAHKGYGTREHRRLIAAHGLSPEHRASFCKKIEFVV